MRAVATEKDAMVESIGTYYAHALFGNSDFEICEDCGKVRRERNNIKFGNVHGWFPCPLF